MNERTLRGLAWFAMAFMTVIIALVVTAIVLNPPPTDLTTAWGSLGLVEILFALMTLSFPLVGVLIVNKQPRNAIGWILLGVGMIWSLGGLGTVYADYGLKFNPGSLPGPAVAASLSSVTWAPAIGLMGTFLILLFPDGRLPSPGWRPWAWFSGISIILVLLVITFTPGTLEFQGYPQLQNPLGLEFLRPFQQWGYLLIPTIPIAIVGCAVALVKRFRRSHGDERTQLKWLTAAAAGVAVIYLVGIAITVVISVSGIEQPAWVGVFDNTALFSFVLIPASIGFAVLKYRLYDIDVVINKTVVYGALAVFITAVYVGIVVGVGVVIGQGDRPNLGLSILATAVVAVAFQPVRERVQRFANRLVYGKRATPYEVLSHFAERMASTYAADELLPQMARVLAEGTGAGSANVWLKVGGELRLAGSWPDLQTPSAPGVDIADGENRVGDSGDLSVEVRDRGELLGALSITKHRGEPATEADRKLLSDLASQAGLVLRNVKLIEELRASRQRIVSAQDEERRRIERNIHDGAQQQLVALNVKLGLAKMLAGRDVEKTDEMLAQLQSETQEALENLRDLARGIYPPLLRDKGLVAALEAQARKVPVPVRVEADGTGRYREDIEATIYFCVLEALQNVVKYAAATNVVVRVRPEGADLAFEVSDDGRGFDPTATTGGTGLQGMSDRLDAVGGSFSMRSQPGAGTTVSARAPAIPAATDAVPSELEPVG